MRDYLRGVVDQARTDGYTATIEGRRRYLPDLTSTNRQAREAAERIALNSPIQGSAADLIKRAMLGVSAELASQGGLKSRLLLQVHDELVLEVAPGEREAWRSWSSTRWVRPLSCPSRLMSRLASVPAGTRPDTSPRKLSEERRRARRLDGGAPPASG